ncbi:Matrixin family protein [Brugia malayi]|uniref:Matrixin family protein n=1 Tax=Brugia malayi TaxID=6279 RepID=A0A4E9F896_BRUMA|nr:Matrixin family protein [Brugia malayi]VIO93010.1 Matrixin family protein [Brugia malayi]
MLRSFQSKDDEYGLTEIIMDDPNNSRKTSWRRDRANKEDIRQISSCSEENRGRRNDHKMTFDEKSMKISKLSSTSFASSNTSNCSEKQLEGNSLKRKYFEAKEQSTNKFSNTTNETIKGDESLKGTEYSPSEKNYTQSDSFASSRNVLQQAFEKWSNSSRGALLFKDLSPSDRTTGTTDANFDVLFAKYAHGDKESFDGFGGIVAHSGYPIEGIIHFDGSEYWSIDGRNGLDLRYVALHEIGHALGLRHSNDPKAIMHPYYSDQLKDFELAEDDIMGIRKLYGIS